jgi:hypothetical protein
VHARNIRLPLLAAVAVAAVASSVVAAPRCEKPCKAETATCILDRCAGLAGDARHACFETCRGIGGCAAIRTLAYVWNVCRSDARGAVLHRELRIRRGNCAPATVMTLETAAPLPDPQHLCDQYGGSRDGRLAVTAGGFQRLAVTPDGSGVVFEMTNGVAVFPELAPDVPEEGFFHVHADGTGLRRLGPPSRVPMFGTNAQGGLEIIELNIAFSPDGRTVTYADKGPGPGGEETQQIVTLEVSTGTRTQLTHLSPSELLADNPRFIDKHTIVFATHSPVGEPVDFYTLQTDGSGFAPLPSITAPGSGAVIPDFSIVGGPTHLLTIALPATSLDDPSRRERELFVWDGRDLLQLTNLGYWSTVAMFLGSRRRALFLTTADPVGENAEHNGQIFSIDTLGRRMRQLTRGGYWTQPLPCNVRAGDVLRPCGIGEALQDPLTDTIVFMSSCDPLETGVFGEQILAMRPDGSRIRQLTAGRGCEATTDGSVTVDMPGPFSYSAPAR